jgi:hypothetical protein
MGPSHSRHERDEVPFAPSGAGRSGYLNLGHRIDVEDEAGQALATVTFKSAVAVQG